MGTSLSQIRDKLVQVMDSCLKVFGCCRFTLASVFFCIEVMPYSLIIDPSRSTFLHPNLHLSTEMAMFLASELSRNFVSLSMYCSLVPCEIIRISSKNANVSFSFLRVRSMAFWNSAGISVSP